MFKIVCTCMYRILLMCLQSLMKLQLFLLCLSPDLSDILADFFKIAFHVVRYDVHKMVCCIS